jgi:hypothetical protein
MDYGEAKALKIAIGAVMLSLDVPVRLAANIDDPQLRQMIGSLAADVAAKIDYEIMPHICAHFPELKS